MMASYHALEKKRSRGGSHDEHENKQSSSEPAPFVELPMYGEHKRAVSSVKFAPARLTKHRKPTGDNNMTAICASASSDGTVKIFDLGSRSVEPQQPESKKYVLNPTTTLVGHSRGINDVAWSPDAPMLATASDDKTLRLWDGVTGDALVEFRGHDNFVFCTQVSGDISDYAGSMLCFTMFLIQ